MSVSFDADRKQLLAAVEDAGRGCAKGGHVAILRGLRVDCVKERVHFTGNNLDITVEASCPATVQGKPVTFVVEDTRKFAAMLKTLDDGPIKVSETGEATTLEQGGTTLRLGVSDPADFPKDRSIAKLESTFAIRVVDFLSTWKRVGKMFSTDESRPVLTTVHVKSDDYRVTFEATDSYRLAFDWMQAKVTGTASALIRGETLELVARFAKRDPDGLITFAIDTTNGVATIEVAELFLTSRLVDGQFPDVEKLIPDTFEGDFDLDAAAAVKACRRVEKLKGNSVMRMIIPTEPGTVRLYTLDAKIVDTDHQIPSPRTAVNGNSGFEIGLNAGFFADSIESLGGDVVTVKYIGPYRPILVVDGKEDAGVLQMPIKLV